MKFKTLMALRNLVVDEMMDIESKLEELNDEVEKMMDQAGTCWIENDEKYGEMYKLNRKEAAAYGRRHEELKDILDEIDNAELR